MLIFYFPKFSTFAVKHISIEIWSTQPLGILRSDDDDGSHNVVQKAISRSFNLHHDHSNSLTQMQANSPGVEFLRITSKFRKKRRISPWRPIYVLQETRN